MGSALVRLEGSLPQRCANVGADVGFRRVNLALAQIS